MILKNLRTNGIIRLTDLEKSWFSQVHETVGSNVPFWIVATDGDDDVTIRVRNRRLLQQVVSHFQGNILFVQVGDGRYLQSLDGVLDLRGEADLRQLVRLLYHSRGVLAPAGAIMRLAEVVEMKGGRGRNRPHIAAANPREPSARQVIRQITASFARNGAAFLTARQWQLAKAAIQKQRAAQAAAICPGPMAPLERVFAVACDGGYYPGLRALLNSIATYHGSRIPVFLYHRGLGRSQLAALRRHPVPVQAFELSKLPFPCSGMWEAKQQILAHCIGRSRCVYLLDADLVLVSALDDVFELANRGRVVSSADGRRIAFDSGYAVYSPDLPGKSQPYINSGALCLDVIRHWDLAGLWAFASKYGAYSPGAGAPLGLPGHGDQGVLNAVAGLLKKPGAYHVLPEGTWCDSTRGCQLRIRRRRNDGRLVVWNVDEKAPQRLVHSSGPKWWTSEGKAYLRQFGDKLECFEHFAALKPRPQARIAVKHPIQPKPVKRARARLLIGVCSCGTAKARRDAIRTTWLQDLPRAVAALFFLGAHAGAQREAAVVLPVADDYASLPRKCQAFFRYALDRYDFDHLFKCDDDTYVRVERLLDLTKQGVEYAGGTEWVREGYASGGAGYLLSRRAVRFLASALPAQGRAEDVWVGRVLREAGIKLCPTPRLRMDHREWPGPGNDLITAHWCSPELLRTIHHGFLRARPAKAAAALPP